MTVFVKSMIKLTFSLTIFTLLFSFNTKPETARYKCLIQMTNYAGPKAYLVISLVNEKGEYIRTLDVNGNDEEWYEDLKEWWAYESNSDEEIDGITGASVGNGERKITVIELSQDKLDSGHKIRFETAVEDQDYFVSDIEIPLTTEEMESKYPGIGYIRYVRILEN
ncbi:MAG: DUF2271 domain-containing protein [Bacteroidota bacterium]